MLNPKDDMPYFFELVDLHLRQKTIIDRLISRAANNEKISANLQAYLEKLDELDDALKKTIDSVEFSFEDELYKKLVKAKQGG